MTSEQKKRPNLAGAPYVLVTPVRNEAATIGITIESVLRQTHLPTEWIVVSDGSTDRTDEIVRNYAAKCGFLRLLRLEKRPSRNFASVVFATEAGIAALQTRDYDFIGLLDGDVRFGGDYYEEILRRFAMDPQLGLAGGQVTDCIEGVKRENFQSLGDVAGAVQFFRRGCWESLGGLVALPEGGWDVITCVQARLNGFRTRTFPELEVDHLKPRNAAVGNVVRRTWQFGVREYALGNHPLFEMVKCGYRLLEHPVLLGGLVRFCGYASCYLHGRRRMLSGEVIQFIRREQLRRLTSFGRDRGNLFGRKPALISRDGALKGG
jgi:glycosyltransferase involved in cell wall biosynthesis